MKMLQKEIQVEGKEDSIFVEMEEIKNGQSRNGFASTQDESRRDIRLEMPPEPEPSRFLDWSSLASPPARTLPHGAPGVQTEPSENAQNQLNVSTTGETRQERVEGNIAEGVVISPQTEQLRDNQKYTYKTYIIA